MEVDTTSDSSQQISEALKQVLLAGRREEDAYRRSDVNAARQQSGDVAEHGAHSATAADVQQQHRLGDQSGAAELSDLGELDITSNDISLEGLDAQLEKFADHDVIHAILDQGSDPKQFRREYEEKLRSAEIDAIQDYVSENNNLITLHTEIMSCDAILADMETMLGGFQEGLGVISAEIRGLQEHSSALSLHLNNRKAAQGRLSNLIEHIAIPGSLIHGIVQGEVDEEWLNHLQILQAKLDFAKGSPAVQRSAAHADVAPELEKLRVKAVTKAREYLMSRIYSLRKPKTNIQILQQNVLLRFRYLVTFLRAYGEEVFAEVRAAYVDTLARVLSSHFRAYQHALDSVKEAGPTAADMVATSEVPTGGMLSLFGRPAADATRAEIFAVGDRGNILLHLDAAALIPHVVEAEGRKLPPEVLFRSVNKLLMDTATSEFLFCSEFFGEDAVFQQLFAATLTAVEAHVSATVQDMFDMVGLLLMVRINYQHRLLMNKRRIPALDGYLDRLNLTLWPRFKVVFDMQLASVTGYTVSTPPPRLVVHPVTHRYAQLTASLLLLNADYEDGQLDHNVGRMRYLTMELLLRVSRSFGDPKLGISFLILNFRHVCMVLRDAAHRGDRHSTGSDTADSLTLMEGVASHLHSVAGKLGALGMDTLKEFQDQLAACTEKYVEGALAQHFRPLVTLVAKAEHAAAAQGLPDGQPPGGFSAMRAGPVIKDFTARWTAALEAMHRDITKDFNRSACGGEVSRAAMTQLLHVYTRALEMLKKSGPEGAVVARDAVTVPSIMYEIKRFRAA